MPFITQRFFIQEEQKAFLWLMRTLHCTQKEAQKILDKGWLTQEGQAIHKSQSICGEISLTHFSPSPLKLPIVLQTPYFVIYDKPAFLLTHPKGTFSHPSLCDALKSEFGLQANPVHRLDKETSGLLLCSINKTYESQLKALFETSQIQKTYLALVRGNLKEEQIIDSPILTPPKGAKHSNLQIRSTLSPQGKNAQTHILPLKSLKDSTLVQATPLTGRTHQIRLHLCSIGHPILGDPLYGCEDKFAQAYLESDLGEEQRESYFGAKRLMLHAYSLKFSFLGENYEVSSPFLIDNISVIP
ncbi:RluA family pseudouridine synthase [Helicobacter brantae]|uniref:RNA pseudouridylate synthase n=1 Tax=Helicobacter brantae TaxID=375927 RepID=A0A3D8IU96_9HELI|nr:RluA family pseudouridine synthase [Helicobacter brantae]RDU68857.1 RluA family pseudouridine synthase [Helicobacter brantae]